jgi:hypothetical protein
MNDLERAQLVVKYPILRYFSYGHLRSGTMREVSARFGELAFAIANDTHPQCHHVRRNHLVWDISEIDGWLIMLPRHSPDAVTDSEELSVAVTKLRHATARSVNDITTTLRYLLEAKDAAVRSVLPLTT